MGGTTAHGYPYVTPTDHPKEFPAHSQALANKLEADTAAIGGMLSGAASIPSSATGLTGVALVGTPTLWGGMTNNAQALTSPVAGLYRITVFGNFPNSGAGSVRMIAVVAAGNAPPAGQNYLGAFSAPSAGTTVTGSVLSASGIWLLTASQSFQAVMRQDSGGTLNGNITLTAEFIR